MEHSREDRLKFAKHFERAQGWLLLDKYAEAESALDEIPAVFQTRIEVLFVRGQLYLEAGQWLLAEPVLRQLLEKDDAEPQHWINLAYVVRRAKSISEANSLLLEASRRFPAVALIRFNLACYASQDHRLQDAHDLLREAIRLEPAFEEMARTDPDLAQYREGLKSGRISGQR